MKSDKTDTRSTAVKNQHDYLEYDDYADCNIIEITVGYAWAPCGFVKNRR